MNEALRVLAEKCYSCKSEEVFEVERNFKNETLAISICPVCRMLNDWELPKGLLDKEGEVSNEDLMDEVYEWAQKEAKSTLIEKDLWYLIKFSSYAEENLAEFKEQMVEKLKELAKILNMQDIYVGIRGKAVNIMIS